VSQETREQNGTPAPYPERAASSVSGFPEEHRAVQGDQWPVRSVENRKAHAPAEEFDEDQTRGAILLFRRDFSGETRNARPE
jgi:hypothetical protein